MDEATWQYVEKYSTEVQTLFFKVRELIIKSVPLKVEEKLWAKLPSYYVEDNSIRVIPFKDHINIQAAAIIAHQAQLKQYKITPKGMLQIYLDQEIPSAVLQTVFTESFLR